jgi:hypothetical protein
VGNKIIEILLIKESETIIIGVMENNSFFLRVIADVAKE